MRSLVLNAGSSTLKAHIVDGDRVLAQHSADWTSANRRAVLNETLSALGVGRRGGSTPSAPGEVDADLDVDAVVHRVVHGGDRFREHTVVDDTTLAAIEALGSLAPLHNAAAVETIRAVRSAVPGVANIACFDTVFHATQPEVSRREPIPAAWAALGIRRYGFHGLSVEWSVGRAAELLGRSPADLELLVAHLGGGASVTAVAAGRSVWCSMGWTPNDGMMMASRSGSLDPAIVTAMVREHGLSIEEVDTALERGAGLLGVSGRSGDVRELSAAAASGDDAARLALDVFSARAAAAIAAAGTWLRRVDAIVFTGGIGEHAGGVRAAIVRRLAVLGAAGVGDDEPGRDRILSAGPPAVLRIEAREELVMARAAAALVGGGAPRT
jgi:acetate kinase